jgi:general stress protein YciG
MANQQRGGSGSFANDPERASEEGKKGAQNSIRNPAVPKISKAAVSAVEAEALPMIQSAPPKPDVKVVNANQESLPVRLSFFF